MDAKQEALDRIDAWSKPRYSPRDLHYIAETVFEITDCIPRQGNEAEEFWGATEGDRNYVSGCVLDLALALDEYLTKHPAEELEQTIGYDYYIVTENIARGFMRMYMAGGFDAARLVEEAIAYGFGKKED